MMTGDLVRITTHFACFGLVARDGKIIQAAPICRWAIGKDITVVASYWRRRGATVELVRAQ